MSGSEQIEDPGIAWEDFPVLIHDARLVARRLLEQEEKAGSVPTDGLLFMALFKMKRSTQKFEELTWANRRHFFSHLRRAMSQVLIDAARKRKHRIHREIPVGSASPEDVAEFLPGAGSFFRVSGDAPDLVIALRSAMDRLEKSRPVLAETAELLGIIGLTQDEVARLQDSCVRTVGRNWSKARAYLRQEIQSIMAEDEC